jgi:hypothetical protein
MNVEELENLSDDYLNIANAVKKSYLPSGELDINSEYKYKCWISNKKFNFKKFSYEKLSDILGDECEEIETKREEDKWYSIFKYKDAYFEFYETGNRIVFIYSDNMDYLYEIEYIDYDENKPIIAKKLDNQLDDYLNIANAVKDSYLPNGELDIDNRYKYWITNERVDFEKFDFEKLSDILGDKCEDIELDDDMLFKIFKFKDGYYKFYKEDDKIVVIHSDDMNLLFYSKQIEFNN